jgi:hypothetical protein
MNIIFCVRTFYWYVISDYVSNTCKQHPYLVISWFLAMPDTKYYQRNYLLYYRAFIMDQIQLKK